jgi:hypothetical protein
MNKAYFPLNMGVFTAIHPRPIPFYVQDFRPGRLPPNRFETIPSRFYFSITQGYRSLPVPIHYAFHLATRQMHSQRIGDYFGHLLIRQPNANPTH